MANLRAIGCPEMTIKIIVTSEVAEIYKEKRQPLEQAARDWERGESKGTTSRASLMQRIGALIQEEATVVSRFLRTPEQREAEAAQVAETKQANDERSAGLAQAVQIPLALRDIYQGGSGGGKKPPALPPLLLTEVYRATVAGVRQAFIQDMAKAATSLQPDDPGYAEMWVEAQVSADERLRTQVGHEVYNMMQVAMSQADEQARLEKSDQ